MQERYNALKAQILTWANEYYVLNAPSVSDAVFDAAFKELQDIEQEHPHLKTPDSPTQKVLGKPSTQFQSVRHVTPMLSLYTETEHTAMGAFAFDARIRRDLGPEYQGQTIVYITEPKYDGLAISLTYRNHGLFQALTRGDGTWGEDVTHSVGLIDNWLPKHVNPEYPTFKVSGYMEVRGEVVMTKSGFLEANKHRVAEGLKPFVNTRNAAAGVIRQHNPRPTDLAGLMFIPYGLSDEGQFNEEANYNDRLAALKAMGFYPEPNVGIALGAEELAQYHRDIAHIRRDMPYDIDGCVYKLNSGQLQKRLGYLSREPRWAVAHKYPPEEVTTLLEDIDVQVGRTGKLTPVARLTPVFVGGAEVSNATLHNFFEIRAKKVQIGDTVIVRRAGDVIPEITGPLLKRTHYERRFSIPKMCPVCGSKVIREKGEFNHYCSGETLCSAQKKARFLHFVSRKAMDIDGMGDAVIEKLLDVYTMAEFTDIYKWEAVDFLGIGFGEKTTRNLLNAIQASKEVPLERFLFGLGIRHVGENTSRILTRHFGDLAKIMLATYEELTALSDIGPIVARSIVNYFKNEHNAGMVIHLASFMLFVVEQRVLASDLLKGKNFVCTGVYPDMPREKYEDFLRSHGAEVQGSISKTTNYLVVGDKPSAGKVDKAKKLGVELITQASVKAMLAIEMGFENAPPAVEE